MAKEHHCPVHGAQPCNASGGIIHVCPIGYERWDEVVEEKSSPAPAPPKPVAPTPAA